jgi:hypothetical protein
MDRQDEQDKKRYGFGSSDFEIFNPEHPVHPC